MEDLFFEEEKEEFDKEGIGTQHRYKSKVEKSSKWNIYNFKTIKKRTSINQIRD